MAKTLEIGETYNWTATCAPDEEPVTLLAATREGWYMVRLHADGTEHEAHGDDLEAMVDRSHLEALQVRLSHERVRLANAQKPGEREIRAVWVAGIEKEIACELARLGLEPDPVETMTDDQLLAALGV